MAFSGYGIDREGIATHIKDIILRVLANYTGPGVVGVGFPADNVFWADQGGSANTPPRPFISYTIGNPLGSYGYADLRRFLVRELWILTLTDDADGLYRVTIAGTDYDYTASGDDIEAIRDALVTAIGSPTEATISTIGDSQIQIVAAVKGVRLGVVASPASILVNRSRKTVISRSYKRVICAVKLRAFGYYDEDEPLAEQGGRNLAEQCMFGFLHADITAAMRADQHVFRKVLAMPDSAGVFEQEYRALGVLDIELATTGHMDATLDNTTMVTVNGSLTGGQTSVVTAPVVGGTPWS